MSSEEMRAKSEPRPEGQSRQITLTGEEAKLLRALAEEVGAYADEAGYGNDEPLMAQWRAEEDLCNALADRYDSAPPAPDTDERSLALFKGWRDRLWEEVHSVEGPRKEVLVEIGDAFDKLVSRFSNWAKQRAADGCDLKGDEAEGAAIAMASVVDYLGFQSVRPASPDTDERADEERLREALELIAQHAALDVSERGVREAERYESIARDALSRASTPSGAGQSEREFVENATCGGTKRIRVEKRLSDGTPYGETVFGCMGCEDCRPNEFTVQLGEREFTFDCSRHGADGIRACTGCNDCLARSTPPDEIHLSLTREEAEAFVNGKAHGGFPSAESRAARTERFTSTNPDVQEPCSNLRTLLRHPHRAAPNRTQSTPRKR